MDTTKQYLLMCEKANEIQVLRPTESNGDWCNWMGDTKCINVGIVILHKNIIWLPRQDQLQEMIKLKSLRQSYINFDFFLGLDRADHRDVMSRYGLNTMEQLWLAFVMKEKYNKIWNGTDWEKDK